MTVYVPERFLALIDNLAAKNRMSRSALLRQIFMLGLRDYAELHKLAAHVVAGEQASREGTHP